MPDKAKPDDSAQSQRFIDMAREVEATEAPNRFEKTFEAVVVHQPTISSKKVPVSLPETQSRNPVNKD